jgi:iron complex transport system substrate-binding protein
MLGVPAAASAPERIVSINICIDQLLWQLVPHERLLSFSQLTADPLWSPMAEQLVAPVAAGKLHLNSGWAEEIMPLRPDLVLAGEYDSSTDAVNLLRRLGVRVERVKLPRTLEDIPAQIASLAQLVGAEAEAVQLIAAINTQLALLDSMPQAAVAANSPKAPKAFWYSSNGVVIGEGTLEHELMRRAGLRNLAAERGIQGFAPLDLELLISARPDLMIIEESNATAYSLAREYLQHPLLKQHKFALIRLPAGLSGCAATAVEDVALALKNQLNVYQQEQSLAH